MTLLLLLKYIAGSMRKFCLSTISPSAQILLMTTVLTRRATLASPFAKNGCQDLNENNKDGPGCDGGQVDCCDPKKINPVVPNNCDPNFRITTATATAP